MTIIIRRRAMPRLESGLTELPLGGTTRPLALAAAINV
jgi:hypothetical protein